MPTKTDRPMSRAEVAEAAGIKRESIDAYQKRGTMPPPDGYIDRTPFWLSSTVQHWVATRKTAPGKPKKENN